MKIDVTGINTDPKARFKTSWKVSKFTNMKLNELLNPEYTKHKVYRLDFWMNTKLNQTKIEIKGPEIHRKDKVLSYGIFLPFKAIDEAPNFLETYLKYYFDALVMALEEFNVKEEEIRKVQKIVEMEVLNNPEYEYEEPIGQIGLSPEEINELLDDDEEVEPKTLIGRYLKKKKMN